MVSIRCNLSLELQWWSEFYYTYSWLAVNRVRNLCVINFSIFHLNFVKRCAIDLKFSMHMDELKVQIRYAVFLFIAIKRFNKKKRKSPR